MENLFKEVYNALLVIKTEDGGDRTCERRTVRMRSKCMMKCKTSQRKIPRYSDEGWERRYSEFLLVDGVLHYKQSVKGGEQRLRQVRVNNLHCHGRIQGERSYWMIMHCVSMQGRIQEFKGGSFKRVRAECGEKFGVTTPTFSKPRPFWLKLAFVSCTRNRLLHCMHVELNCTEIIL